MKFSRRVGSTMQAGPWLLTGVFLMGACGRTSPPPDSGAVSAADSAALANYRPECPEHEGLRIMGLRRVVPLVNLAVPGKIAGVPEFHDCQKFITETGNAYGPLVAIYASEKLDSLWTPQQVPQVPTKALALIYNYGEAYSHLRIGEKQFSCLYILRDPTAATGFTAYMRGVGEDQQLCNDLFDPTTLPPGTKLNVLRKNRSPRFQDYPAVARWDWDAVRKQQYIGIRCGAAWCSVSSPGLNESRDYDDDSPPMTDEKRVHRIKGWYDEQRLAVAAGTDLRPEDALGTIIPDGKLHERNDTLNFRNKWIPVARIAFTSFPPSYPYHSKFGFTATSMGAGRVNRVDMCQGRAAKCLGSSVPIPPKCTDGPEAWWARIKPADTQAPTTYRCVDRHGHEALNLPQMIPATARWRWLLADETLWVRCAQGCCTVTGEE